MGLQEGGSSARSPGAYLKNGSLRGAEELSRSKEKQRCQNNTCL